MALCYRSVGLKTEAEKCYTMIIDHDSTNYDAHIQRNKIRQASEIAQQRTAEESPSRSTRQHKSTRRAGDKIAKRSKSRVAPPASSTSMLLAPRPVYQSAKQLAVEKEHLQWEEVYSLFTHREDLQRTAGGKNEDCKAEWMATTKALLQAFRDNKVFYPFDRHQRFFGYSKEARGMASRPKHELDALTESSRSIFGMSLRTSSCCHSS